MNTPALLMEFTMSVSDNIEPSSSDPCRADSQEERHGVRLGASRIGSSTVIVGCGEVDACNADDVAAYVVSHLDECNQLVLDFSRIGILWHTRFFGIASCQRRVRTARNLAGS